MIDLGLAGRGVFSVAAIIHTRQPRRRKWVWLSTAIACGLIVILAGLVCLLGSVPASFEAGSIEDYYAAAGSEDVEALDITDAGGNKQYKVYYPSALGGPYPLIAWGNGTGALPKNYDPLFRHLASWGFVVIDSYSTETGTGADILASIEYMLAENDNPDSPFYQHIIEGQIAAAGHSQGSTGAINAHTNFERGTSLIKTVVSIALPSLKWCDPEDVYDTSKLRAPFFIMGGTRDIMVSPLSANRTAIEAAANRLPAAMGMAAGAGHTAIEDDGGKHRGYLTAWMRFQLMGDAVAKGAFAGADAELLSNPDWKHTAAHNL